MHRNIMIVMALLLLSSYASCAEEPKLEHIEWTDVWVMNANQDTEARVLFVGDSIVKGYYDNVEKALGEKVSCARYATSLFLSNPDYLAELSLLLNRYDFDVIHINNGLHGWDYSEEEYKSGLTELLATIKHCSPEATIIWCMTTPVRVAKDVANLDAEKNNRVIERNRIAAEIMKAQDIPVNDLYAAVIDHPEFFAEDGVHFNGKGQVAQGEQVAKSIEKHLLEGIK